MRLARFVPLIALPLAALAPAARAQNPAPPPPACTTPEYRQFDFWVGDWIVENPQNGQRQGTSSVTLGFDRCVLTEHWSGVGGTDGSSFNIYDRTRQVWHQTWVSNRGALLLLEGRLLGGRMVLSSAPAAGPNGATMVNRVTWSPLEGGRVEQRWETSSDGGATWQITFLGVYRRA